MKQSKILLGAVILGTLLGCDKLPSKQAAENDEFKCDIQTEDGSFSRTLAFTVTCEAKKQTIRLHNLEVSVTERKKVSGTKAKRRTQAIGTTRLQPDSIEVKPGKPFAASGKVSIASYSGITGNRDLTLRGTVTYPEDKRSFEEIEQEKINMKDKYNMFVKKDL